MSNELGKINGSVLITSTEGEDVQLLGLILGSFGGLVVSMLASGTQVRGFKPG
jgi:hypothetical protein